MKYRTKSRRHAALLCLVAALVLPTSAYAESAPASGWAGFDAPRAGAVVFDLAILRPIGFVTVVVGAALFVPAVILASPSGMDGIRTALEVFVEVPAEDVFQRPLGDF